MLRSSVSYHESVSYLSTTSNREFFLPLFLFRIFVFDGPAPALKKRVLAGRSNKRKQKKDMEIETEFALFSKKIKLNSLNPSVNQEIDAPPEVEEIDLDPSSVFQITADDFALTGHDLEPAT